MRLLIAPIATLLLAGCSADIEVETESPDPEADIAELTRIKQQDWNGYFRNRDAEGLAEFLDDEFIVLEGNGTFTDKADSVDYVSNNDWPLATRNFEYSVTKIQLIASDVANVFGRGTYDGDSCRMGYTSSNILRREGGSWHPVFSHTSPAACEDESAA